MVKKEVRGFKIFVVLWSVLFAIVFISIAQGFDVITGGSLNSAGHISAREDVNFTINITVNNTALLAYDNNTSNREKMSVYMRKKYGKIIGI